MRLQRTFYADSPADSEEVARAGLAAEPANPFLSTYLGAALMEQGKYEEGWPLAAAGMEDAFGLVPSSTYYSFRYEKWCGQSLKGKRIVLRMAEGLGDAIMMARFVRSLYAKGSTAVALACAPPLHRLFEQLDVTCVAFSSVPDFRLDYWANAFSVPAVLGVDLHAVRSKPYLKAKPAALPPGITIGVAARGNPTHDNDAHRSLPPDLRERLQALPGAMSLLPEHTCAADFAETAALIAALDLVITVDTSIAHLAGAMGKPVWIMLPANKTDWRWMREGTDSPWYPSARLYRQREPGGWAAVLDEVERDLAQGVEELQASPLATTTNLSAAV
jgi:hypothetical protein